MMRIKKVCTVIALLFIVGYVYPQSSGTSTNSNNAAKKDKKKQKTKSKKDDSKKSSFKFQIPNISAGAGILSFYGDIGKGAGISSYSRIRGGYNLSFEEPITNYLGVSINGLYGKLSESERSTTRNLNFQSQIMQGDLNVIFHFDNNFILKNGCAVAPFLSAGFGFMTFDPYGDLKDKNGNSYFYWTDGSIRNMPETNANFFTAKIIQRDYTYETRLTDSTNNYPRHTFSVPLGGGIKFKITDHFFTEINAHYYITFSDYIDNLKANGNNDSYLYSSVSLTYKFGGGKKAENPMYQSVDFSAIGDADGDHDGVSDFKDQCPNTPKGVKVDQFGCPLDSDGDGVPDYLDKEPHSAKGAIVDQNGVTLTQAALEARQRKYDSLATDRSTMFNDNPSLKFMHDVDVKIKSENNGTPSHKIPAEFQSADENHDGFISSQEISDVIDGFFDGKNDYTVDKINKLIDYFFDQ